MKKIVVVLLVTFLTLTVIACNNQDDYDLGIGIEEANVECGYSENDESNEAYHNEADYYEYCVEEYDEYNDDYVEFPDYIYEKILALEDEFEDAMVELDEKHLAIIDSLDDIEDIERYDELLDDFLEYLFDKLDELYDQLFFYEMDIEDFIEEFQSIIELLRGFRFQ